MPLLAWIILFTAIGGIASAAFAAVFLLVPDATGRRLLPHFISYATGALLGAALLALLPDAIESVGPEGAHGIGAALLLGLGIFFVIEKLVLWWHTHSDGRMHTVTEVMTTAKGTARARSWPARLRCSGHHRRQYSQRPGWRADRVGLSN